VGLAVAVATLLGSAALVTVDDPRLPIVPVTLACALSCHHLLGQLQARARHAAMGLAATAGAAALCGFVHVDLGSAPPEVALYVAVPVAYAAATLVAAVVVLAGAGAPLPEPRRAPGQLAAGLVLALAVALLPGLDLINMRFAQDDAALGALARASLPGRAIFLLALALLQAAMPFHLRVKRERAGPRTARRVRAVELGILALALGASAAAAWLAPALAQRFLAVELHADQRLWVLLSCLGATALWGHARGIQIASAQGRWRMALLRLAPLAATVPVFAVVRMSSITLYLGVVAIWAITLDLVFLPRSA
jgi:hypothetical protein